METRKQWLGVSPWDKVLTVNQDFCQAQRLRSEYNARNNGAARELWEKALAQSMTLADALDVCRRCQELAPFAYNNPETFAAVSNLVIEEWAQALPSVEAQMLRNTAGRYASGAIGKGEVVRVVRYLEKHFRAGEAAKKAPAPARSAPISRPGAQPEPSRL